MPQPDMNNRSFNVVGASLPRVGAVERLLAEALFAGDIRLDGALRLAAVRSPTPHATVESIDIGPAMKIPGCVAVFTHKDIPGRNRFGIIVKDQPLLADGKVRFVGDPVALVAADTAEAAEAAAAAVRATYHDLSPVFDPEEALKPSAALIHETGNLLGRRLVYRGDPDEAFKRADIIVERVYATTFVEHAYLEPDAGLAFIADDGRLVIHASTQNPHYDRTDVADLLGIEEDRVRVVQAATGGGFGSKLDLNVQGFVALAAFLLKRPALMLYTREEAFLATPKRHPLKIHYRSAASKDGKLLAIDVRTIGDTGAYASYGPAVLGRTAIHATGPYEVPNVRSESIFAYTNNPIAGAMRGFGVPQAAFAHESQMDILAQELGLSPLEIRRRNVLRVGAFTATGQELKASVGAAATLDAITPHYERALQEKRGSAGRRKRGVGLAAMMYGIGNTGMRNPSTARIELDKDGAITLCTGAADIGQGSSTVLRQIAAEALGAAPEEIRLVAADTLHTTSAGATSASRQTYISGNAALEAAKRLRAMILAAAADALSCNPDDVEINGQGARRRSNPAAAITLRDIALRAALSGKPLNGEGFFDPTTTGLDPKTGQGIPYATYAFAAQAAEVEVDALTGEVQVLRVTAAHDVGRAINPQNVLGQIYSGVAMGLGFALMEEFVPGKTLSMTDYDIPSAADMPEINAVIVEDPEPTGPFGAKGVGEPALIPTAPAIANAISDALGVRIYGLPANLERVMKAIQSLASPAKT